MAHALVAGNLSEDVVAVILLTAPQAAAQLGNLDFEQALALLEAMPSETALLLQPLLVDAARLTMLLLAAHMIIFWLSQDSNVTPPVCLCTFTAATIAKTPPIATGFTSWKVAKSLYIMPLLFAYTPLLTGSVVQTLEVGLYTLLGLYAFTSAVQGWQKVQLNLMWRSLMALCALGLLWPLLREVHLLTALVLIGACVWLDRSTTQN